MTKWTLKTTTTIIIALVAIQVLCTPEKQVILTNLNDNWTVEVLKCPGIGESLKGFKMETTLPSTIHMDLLKHKKIEDPYFRSNYPTLRWISECSLKYSRKFSVKKEDLTRTSQLTFHGIDTYSNVTLNGIQILKTNNSFVAYTSKVSKFLKEDNEIEVVIESTESYDSEGQKNYAMPSKYAQTRKACYQYSWDWAPEMVTMGIWKNVELKTWDELRIDYVWVRNKIIKEDSVILNFATKLTSERFKEDPLEKYSLKISNGPKELKTIQITQQTAYADVRIDNPQFWWPNGIGQPYVYDFVVELLHSDQVIDKKTITFGIRTIELDLSNLQFKVVVNGYPVYCKGANYVPLDMLHSRLTNKNFQTQKTYTFEKLFNDAVESNFNMIRLWGGGQYEDNQFYELASRKGIMIFHDFMFSDSIYPSYPDFLYNVELEIKQQVRRIRNYPALALWCGNNEILQGIHDWGWNSEEFKKDYQTLFENLIKRVVEIQHPTAPYIPSSPIYGVGNYGFERGGDFHFWSVWAGGASFDQYEKAVGPFNSEFGTQAFPVWETIKQFTNEDDRSYNSPVLLTHERHTSQFQMLKKYIQMYTRQSRDFESQVYLSGIVQAMGIEIAIVAQRSSKPKSYGTLYWQFNDAWPGISWSAIDYFGRWKPLQFMAKRIYPNIAIFTLSNNSVVAINDNLEPVDVLVRSITMDFDGNMISNEEAQQTLSADSVKSVFVVDNKQISKFLNKVVTVTEIYHKDKLQVRHTKYYASYKDLELSKATITCSRGFKEQQLIFQTDKVVRHLYINLPGLKISDNYFDIVPGLPVTVKIMDKSNSYETIRTSAKFLSVRQASIKGEEVKVNFK